MLRKKAFTLIETLITLAILLIVLSLLYMFFHSSYRIYNDTGMEINAQEQGNKAIETITEKAMQCSKMLQVIAENNITIYNYNDEIGEEEKKGAISVKSIKIDNAFEKDGYYKFYLRENKLYMATRDDWEGKVIAEGVDKFMVKPAGNGGYFSEAKGIYVKLQLFTGGKRNTEKVMETEIYFRN